MGVLELSVCTACGLIKNDQFDPARMTYDTSYDNALHFSRDNLVAALGIVLALLLFLPVMLHAAFRNPFEHRFHLRMPGSRTQLAVNLVSQFFLAYPSKKRTQALARVVDFAQRLVEVAAVVLFPTRKRLLEQGSPA